MNKKQLSIEDLESSETLNHNSNEEFFFYMKDSKREVVPVNDPVLNEAAKQKLSMILNNTKDIPREFLENWQFVKLYSPKGDIDSANSLILNPKNGAYNLNNKLNDLTGKEWTKFTCSWFIFNALQSDLKEEREISQDLQHHPATYSPTMIADFIKFFTKEGSKVIDPFAGIGSTLVSCRRINRVGYGIELSEKYFELIKLRVPEFIDNIFNYDSTKLDELSLPMFDFSISSPPYWDVLNRSTDRFKIDRESRGLDSKYSNSQNDLGNVGDYDDFLTKVCMVYEKLYSNMKDGSYLCIIVKNVKKEGKLYPLAWDIASRLSKIYVLKDEKIWIQDKVSLSPYGYPHSWASNILHHYCLIFRKE